MDKVNWLIAPNTPKLFSVYDTLDANWKEVKGLYVFAKILNNKWQAVYIGKTENLRQRFSNHERLEDINEAGASHVHVAALSSVTLKELDNYETYLIKTYMPLLNIMKK